MKMVSKQDKNEHLEMRLTRPIYSSSQVTSSVYKCRYNS